MGILVTDNIVLTVYIDLLINIIHFVFKYAQFINKNYFFSLHHKFIPKVQTMLLLFQDRTLKIIVLSEL